ncbi:hypothetical protein ACVITL_003851 [Rhizobium pisi]
MLALFLLAAPPGGDRGQLQILAQKMPTDGRHEGEKRPGFENAGAERIDDGDAFGAQRFDEAWRADMRILVQLQRIGEGRIETAPEHADRLEASDRAHHDAALDDGEILALKQHEAEITGDVSVLVVGLVGGTGRQHGDAVVARMLHALKRVAEGTEEGGEAVDRGFGIDIREGPGCCDTVFQCETGA